MKVQIFGADKFSCQKLAENAQQALKEIGIEAEVKFVTDMKRLLKKGINITPALVIDNKVVSQGAVLTVKEIKEIIWQIKRLINGGV